MLADGTRVSQNGAVSKQGIWPLYGVVYGGKGALMSWIQFTTNQPDSDLSGDLIWIKPGGLRGAWYPGGFTNAASAMGSRYHAISRARVLEWINGSMSFRSGGLSAPFTKPIWPEMTSHRLALTINPANGVFTGKAVNPETGRSFSFQGVLLDKGNIGAGFFLSPAQSGEVYLQP